MNEDQVNDSLEEAADSEDQESNDTNENDETTNNQDHQENNQNNDDLPTENADDAIGQYMQSVNSLSGAKDALRENVDTISKLPIDSKDIQFGRGQEEKENITRVTQDLTRKIVSIELEKILSNSSLNSDEVEAELSKLSNIPENVANFLKNS